MSQILQKELGKHERKAKINLTDLMAFANYGSSKSFRTKDKVFTNL